MASQSSRRTRVLHTQDRSAMKRMIPKGHAHLINTQASSIHQQKALPCTAKHSSGSNHWPLAATDTPPINTHLNIVQCGLWPLGAPRPPYVYIPESELMGLGTHKAWPNHRAGVLKRITALVWEEHRANTGVTKGAEQLQLCAQPVQIRTPFPPTLPGAASRIGYLGQVSVLSVIDLHPVPAPPYPILTPQ